MFDQLIAAPAKTAAKKGASAKPAPAKKATPAPAPAAAKPVLIPAPTAASKASATRKATPKQAPSAVASIKFAAQDFARPSQGRMLASHTAAFLNMSGMLGGGAVPRATAVRIMGATAVRYHTGNGNFIETAGGLKVTDKGIEFFIGRALQADPELVAHYETFFATGAMNAAINIKTAGSVVKL